MIVEKHGSISHLCFAPIECAQICSISSPLQPSVRKTHCSGRKHKENVKDYYQKWMEEQAQSLIDKTSEQTLTVNSLFMHLGHFYTRAKYVIAFEDS